MGVPPLRDPATQFLNRFVEKRIVEEFYRRSSTSANRCLIVRATRDVGLTYFLRHLEQTADKKWLAVYVDCASSDPEVVYRRFFERLEERPLRRFRALSMVREFGEAIARSAATLLHPGPALAFGTLAGAVVPQLASTPYASTASERFSRLVTSGAWTDPVLFLVDNAQEIKPQSLHVLNTAFSQHYDHVRFVLSFVAGDAAADIEEFEGRLQGFGLGVETIDFQPPDDRLVALIAEALEVRLPHEERHELLRTTRGSLSRILAVLHPGAAPSAELSALERELLRFLLVAEQPLQREDLLSLVRQSPRIAAPTPEVQQAIDRLSSKKLVMVTPHWLNDEVAIAPAQGRTARGLVDTFADIVCAGELYAYFSTIERVRSARHSKSAYAALLYKLAGQVDPAAVAKRAFELVRISLAQADLSAAEHYLHHAIGTGHFRSVSDLYALLAFQVSVQDYGRALRTLDELGREYWCRVRMLRIVHAVALNRVREHGEAAAEIDALLAEPETSPEEFALLVSYRVAGLLHDGELARARELFESSREQIRQAANRGYALRNCAAVYFWGQGRNAERADTVLTEAIDVFDAQQDAFGRYTTLNNRGALIGLGSGRLEAAAAALPHFEGAFEALSIFGTHHLEEVGANLGVALLLSGDYDRAAVHLRKMAAIASCDFPRVLIESALAFTEVLGGEPEEASARMRRLTREVATVKLSEAVYRANVNAAAVETIAGGNAKRVTDYVEAAGASGFWGGRTSLARVVEGVRGGAITLTTLPRYFSYDYFQYWSQNPLSALPAPVLPAQAVGDDVLQ